METITDDAREGEGKKAEDGGPAFPQTANLLFGGVSQTGGMTLRDWFAGLAMQGMCATSDDDYGGNNHPDDLATDAYAIADAMIAARKSEGRS